MAELVTVARPYAEAAFQVALEAKDLHGWSTLLRLAATIAEDADMAALLANPRVSMMQKQTCFQSVIADKLNSINPALTHLVNTLIEGHRAVLLGPISAQFEAMKHAHENVLKARIVSAFAMDDAGKNGLVDALARKYGKSIESELVIDATLIGGVRIEIGDEVIHASVRDTLDKMTLSLAQ